MNTRRNPTYRRNKYGAKRDYRCLPCGSAAIVGGLCKSCGKREPIAFDSRAEGRRYDELRLLENAGQITNLQRQVAYPIVVNGVTVGKYLADFVYQANGETVIEDVKGKDTALSKFKRKAVQAMTGIPVAIVRR